MIAKKKELVNEIYRDTNKRLLAATGFLSQGKIAAAKKIAADIVPDDIPIPEGWKTSERKYSNPTK